MVPVHVFLGIMHQHAIFANEVDVFIVDFEVENGLRAGARKFLLDDFDVAAERLQSLSNLKRPRLHELLTVHRPDRMIRRRAEGLGFAGCFRFEVFGVRNVAGRRFEIG
jgi:hypothetical protein